MKKLLFLIIVLAGFAALYYIYRDRLPALPKTETKIKTKIPDVGVKRAVEKLKKEIAPLKRDEKKIEIIRDGGKSGSKIYTVEDLKRINSNLGKADVKKDYFTNEDMKKYKLSGKKQTIEKTDKDKKREKRTFFKTPGSDSSENDGGVTSTLKKGVENVKKSLDKLKDKIKKPEILDDPEVKKLLDKKPSEIKKELQEKIDKRNQALEKITKEID